MPKSRYVNLKHLIDKISALNVDETKSSISILELVSNTIIHNKSFIRSKTDEELLIFVTFKDIIDLKSITLSALSQDIDNDEISAPKQVHIYKIENLNLGFNDIQSMKPHQSIGCSLKRLKIGQNIKLQKKAKTAIKFKGVKHLAVYIASNQNQTENTFINSIAFNGDVNNDLYKQTRAHEADINDSKIKHIQRLKSSTNYGAFRWSFGGDSSVDIECFKRTKQGQVTFISDYHDIGGCIIFFEMTPNGWKSPKGDVYDLNIMGKTMVWLRLHSLPLNTTYVSVRFQYKCVTDTFSFIGEKDAVLARTDDYSITTNNAMYFSGFEDLDTFSFECYVTVNQDTEELKANYPENELRELIQMPTDAQVTHKELLCDNNVKQCDYVKELSNVMKIYDKRCIDNGLIRMNYDNLFLHLLFVHNNDDDFEYIVRFMGDLCNIQTCAAFNKLYANRGDNTHAIVHMLDKIHCFYKHSYDIGYRFRSTERNSIFNEQKDDEKYEDEGTLIVRNERIRKTQQIVSNKHKAVLPNNQRHHKFNDFYSYGQHFCYDIKSVHSNILPRYLSLKEELTTNTMCVLTVEQWDNELNKAVSIFNSRYRKDNYHNLALDLLISLMIYCNYDGLQRIFSETYWKYIERHNQFYHFGKYICEAVNNCGTSLAHKNKDKSLHFYHGINKPLILPKLIGPYLGVQIYTPLSTSSSFAVAAHFTVDQNSGILVEFGCPNIRIAQYDCNKFDTLATRYFDVRWLSDFPAESELLFIQMKSGIYINDIMHMETGDEYKGILDHLKIIDGIIMSEPKDWHCWKLEGKNASTMKSIIEHQLSIQLPTEYKSLVTLNDYGKGLIGIYFNNIRLVDVNYKHKESKLFIEIVEDKISLIQIMFPNVQRITIRNRNVDKNMMENILNLWKHANGKSKVKSITLYPSLGNDQHIIAEKESSVKDQQSKPLPKAQQSKPLPKAQDNDIDLENIKLISTYGAQFQEIGYCMELYDEGKAIFISVPIGTVPPPQRPTVGELILGKESSVIINIAIEQ